MLVGAEFDSDPLSLTWLFPLCLNNLLSLRFHSIPFLAWCLGCQPDGCVRMEKAMGRFPAAWVLRAFPWSPCVALEDQSGPQSGFSPCGMQWAQEVVRSSIPLCHCGRKVGPLLPGCRCFLSSVPSLINLVSQQAFTEHPPWANFVQDEKELKGKEGNFRLKK